MTALRTTALLLAGAGLALMGVWAWDAGHGPERDSEPTASTQAQAQAQAAPENPLALDAGQRARLGVTIGTAAAASDEAGTAGFARALDVGPLAAIDSEILAAAAAATASAAEAARLGELAQQDQSASARSVQAAASQAMADRQRTALAERRVALEFGAGLARLSPAARATLVTEVAAARAALLRIDIPGADVAVSRASVGDPPAAVTILGPAAAADARVQGAAVLAVLRGPRAREALAGRLLPAHIAGGHRETGVLLPDAAVVRAAGRLWVFVPVGAAFERRAIDGARPVTGGWFVPAGLRPGDRVVTAGAGALLGIENGPAPADD